MAGTFSADLRQFANLTQKKMRYVAVNAIQDVMEAAQTPQVSAKRRGGPPVLGKIPVDTSDLIKSLVSGIGQAYGPPSETSYVAVIAGMQLGDELRFAWTAEYALRVELGFTGTDNLGRSYNQPGAHFVGANAARWSDFVDKRAAEVRT